MERWELILGLNSSGGSGCGGFQMSQDDEVTKVLTVSQWLVQDKVQAEERHWLFGTFLVSFTAISIICQHIYVCCILL